MIRFVDLGDQLQYCNPQFAWFDTISDSFIEMCGNCVWDCWEEFELDFVDDINKNFLSEGVNSPWPLERFKRLFPEEWPAISEQIESEGE